MYEYVTHARKILLGASYCTLFIRKLNFRPLLRQPWQTIV